MSVLKKTYSIYRFSKDARLPRWIYTSDFYSITKTEDELSVVAVSRDRDSGKPYCSHGWRIIKVIGPLDFSLTGIIAGISSILSKESIPVFTLSTFDTDYFLIRETDLERAVSALRESGNSVAVQE